MKRKQLARDLARNSDIPVDAAQDKVDEMVHEILRKLRAGEPVELRRLGKLVGRRANGK